MTESGKVSKLTLEQLFPNTLTDTSCVYVDKDSEVWVATEMCAQYLESTIDSLVVKDNGNHIGIVGGYDLLDHLRQNPTRDFQYNHKVEEVMFKGVPTVTKQTTFEELMTKWKDTRRAFGIIENNGQLSPISARKILEAGMNYETDISISSFPTKNIVTFDGDEPIKDVINKMFDNKTRKLLLANSNQFISDRTILEGLSRMIKFQKDVDNFLEVAINQVTFDHIKVITDDVNFSKLCSIMNTMEHPYVIYKDNVISPWDVCLMLYEEPIETAKPKNTCSHCGHTLE